MRSRGPLAPLSGVVLVAALTLSACGDQTQDDAGAGSAGGGDDVVASPSADPVALDCPPELAVASDVPAPATGTAQVPALQAALVCTYDSTSSPDGTWTLQGDPVDVPDDALPGLSETVAELQPASTDQMCTMDMGPRTLLLGATAEGTIGVVVEDYGCRDVLLTSDPTSVAPGDGGGGLAVPGTFGGGADLLDRLGALAG